MRDSPATVSEIQIPVEALGRADSLTTNTNNTVVHQDGNASSAVDGWLLNGRLRWHQHHSHHYGECADSCRAMPDAESAAAMEIENLGNLACIAVEEEEDALAQWILKAKKGKIVVAAVIDDDGVEEAFRRHRLAQNNGDGVGEGALSRE